MNNNRNNRNRGRPRRDGTVNNRAEEAYIQEIMERRRSNPNYDPDNSMYDRESDENYNLSEDDEEFSDGEKSNVLSSDQESEYVERRQNYHEQ